MPEIKATRAIVYQEKNGSWTVADDQNDGYPLANFPGEKEARGYATKCNYAEQRKFANLAMLAKLNAEAETA